MLAEIAAMYGARQVLHKLHGVAVRVLDHEAPVAVGVLIYLGRHLDALTRQIVAQLADIFGFETDPDEPVFCLALERRRDFHVLMVVDLETGLIPAGCPMISSQSALIVFDIA